MEASHGPLDSPRTGNRKCPECLTVYPNEDRFCTRDGFALVLDGAPPDIIGTLLGNKYRVERLIGSGAMGDVYQVRHVRLDQVRAVKKMHSASTQGRDAMERFRREAKQQSRIRHPNVATLYDFEEESDGGCFLVMEFVDGKPLADVIAENVRMPPPRVATIVVQMAAALDAAHDAGVVHRDLKPDNVLIAPGRDGTDRVKVVDFGIATLIGNDSTRITSSGVVVGTPRYMSPEQLLSAPGETIDGRSDVYTLGLVAMEMLVGFLPFGNRDIADIMKRATSAPPRISDACAEQAFPVALDAVFARALAMDREKRYAAAGAFARELVAVLSAAGLSPDSDRLSNPTPMATLDVQRLPAAVRKGTSVTHLAALTSLALTIVVGLWLIYQQSNSPNADTQTSSISGVTTDSAKPADGGTHIPGTATNDTGGKSTSPVGSTDRKNLLATSFTSRIWTVRTSR